MVKYNVAILGCGAIFNRHSAAIIANKKDFNLVGVYDTDAAKSAKFARELGVVEYGALDDVFADDSVNCIVVLTPSHLHYEHASRAIAAQKHVIVEKPACFYTAELEDLIYQSTIHNVNIFCILQVRLNKSIQLMQQVMHHQLLGNIRGASFIQRWQRPLDYFSGWRGKFATSGGILSEFAIHYLDVMQYLLGVPEIKSANFFQTKFKNSDVPDSIYALGSYGEFGVSIEVSIGAEPHNLECSLSVMGGDGYIKLSGKSLDVVEEAKFLDVKHQDKFNELTKQINAKQIVNQVTQGACPHHPELYRLIVDEPELFDIKQTYNVISLIEQIYKFKG